MENLREDQMAGLNELQNFENGIQSRILIIPKSKRKIFIHEEKDNSSPSESSMFDDLTIFEDEIYPFLSRQNSTQTLPGFYVGE